MSGGLGLKRYPLVFDRYRFLQRKKFSIHQNYIFYLEYFQQGNGFGGIICWCFLVEILNYNIMLKNNFYSLKPTGVDSFKTKV